MTDEEKISKDILLEFYKDNVLQGRHHETQRASVTTSILAIATIIIGIITFDKKINPLDLSLTFFLILIGTFGILFTLKHYERYSLHLERARVYRNKLDVLFTGNLIAELKKEADDIHNKHFPRLSKLRLYYWWGALHAAVVLVGILLTMFALFWPQCFE